MNQFLKNHQLNKAEIGVTDESISNWISGLQDTFPSICTYCHYHIYVWPEILVLKIGATMRNYNNRLTNKSISRIGCENCLSISADLLQILHLIRYVSLYKVTLIFIMHIYAHLIHNLGGKPSNTNYLIIFSLLFGF